MEKKLITFEQMLDLQDPPCYECSAEICTENSCPLWQSLESPEENITIVPANGAKRNGWM